MSADRDGIWDVLRIIFSAFEGWFGVFVGFLDETEKQKGVRLTGVGGFIFRKEELDAVQQKLRPLGPPRSISQLRFYGNQDKVNDIARIVAEHRGEGFICTVLEQDFHDWQSQHPQNAKWLGTPYSICMLHLMDIIRSHLQDSEDEIFYFIESGAIGANEARILLNRILDNESLRQKFRLRNFNFVPKDYDPDGLLLLSADLLVSEWQWNYRLSEIAENEGRDNSEWSEPMKLLFRDETDLPINHFRLTPGTLRTSALWVLVNGLSL